MTAATRPPLAMIFAAARNGCIGKNGGLPWHLSEDLEHFKRTTRGHTVIMGRRTFESIGRPLPGRRNLVVSRRAGLRIPGVEVFDSIDRAIETARTTDSMPFILGGADIYRAALDQATRLYVTEVQIDVDGDTFFTFDQSDWVEVERRPGERDPVVFVTYERK